MTDRPASRFFRGRDGRLVLFQWPNPAIVVFFLALALRWSPWDARDSELLWLGRGALIVWAVDELVRGDAPVRRLLGTVVLAWQIFVLVG